MGDVLRAVRTLPAGRFLIGFSGGADSTALLHAMKLTVPRQLAAAVHIDHAARPESAREAQRVSAVCRTLGVDCRHARLSPGGDETRWRQDRLDVFRKAVGQTRADGVVLAHHADDLAETVAMRLIRNRSMFGLSPMRSDATTGSLRVLRPMLGLPKRAILDFLERRGLVWCEDASNNRPVTLRNRMRHLLRQRPALAEALHDVAKRCEVVERLVGAHAEHWKILPETLHRQTLLEQRSARDWLRGRHLATADINATTVDRLLKVLADPTPRSIHLPGSLRVRRRGRSAGGVVEVSRLERPRDAATPPVRS